VASREGGKCPCLVASLTDDKGKNWRETVLAEAGGWNNTGTVRYPVSAASPAAPGHYAVAAYQPDHKSVKVFYTVDGGKSWKSAAPAPMPATVAVASVSQVGIGYSNDGHVLVTWRAFRNPGAFNTFAAMMSGDGFGPTVKISPALSEYPPLTYDGNYGGGNGGGDFTTWITANDRDAFIAFPYAPGGAVEDTWLARVPLAALK